MSAYLKSLKNYIAKYRKLIAKKITKYIKVNDVFVKNIGVFACLKSKWYKRFIFLTISIA